MTSPIMKIKHTAHVMSNFLRACVLSWCFKLVSFRLWQWKACASCWHSNWVLRYSSSELSSKLEERIKTEWRKRDQTQQNGNNSRTGLRDLPQKFKWVCRGLVLLAQLDFLQIHHGGHWQKILPNNQFQITSAWKACNKISRTLKMN